MLLTAQATGGSGSSAQSQAEGSLESQNSANMATAAQTAVLDNRQAELQKEMQKVQKNEAIVGGVISAGLSYSSGGTIQ